MGSITIWTHANTKAFSITLGGNGEIGGSGWAYDLAFTGSQQKLTEKQDLLLTDELESFFSDILGPDLGADPVIGAYPTFRPDYDAFFRPITPEQFATFDTDTSSHSKTTDSMLRAQITQSVAVLAARRRCRARDRRRIRATEMELRSRTPCSSPDKLTPALRRRAVASAPAMH